MEILIPNKTNTHWQGLLKRTTSIKPMKPFAGATLLFLQEFSKRLLHNKRLAQYPELKAIANWFSKTHLQQLHQDYESKRQNRIWLPRGVTLHFTPANIDSIFIASWFLSLLAGNINVVRLPQNRSAQTQLILDLLNSILGLKRFKAIRERTLVVSYAHQRKITEQLSRFCHLRVIWGGDETILNIRAVPLPPRATELLFADRFSMAAIKAEVVLNGSKVNIDRLAKNFYNDTFRLNQNACASPRLIFWIGKKKELNRAKNRFWAAFKKVARQKNINWNDQGGTIIRMLAGYRYAACGIADKLLSAATELPYKVHLKNHKAGLREIHPGGGLFLETEKSSLLDILKLITLKDQTLAVYGFPKHELEKFAWQLSGRGIDRIVPIGEALSFQVSWDGYDLWTYFTREVALT
ncbi:acyl-CoA reductase [Candidatus Omnitrophota bacterium]